ncbi:phosphatidylglycerophosphatase A family protein [Desulfonatronovibrio hydrogenovorans]|uniref:phosphatidylglycerophosphatase A family protein n=1 Tax=Desulfonatronovibrio hydrogenovorans TaxID=53245 RepID=UPI0004904682|nr:phosphatidylglycerophosphatase A [Desulfonatronovibrio hydrogenovorans]
MNQNNSFDSLMTSLATLGPVGHLPKMPGTWGSLVAAGLAPFVFIPFSLGIKLVILALLFFAGAWACKAAEQTFQRKDPSQAVIDEVLGQWTVFLFITSASVFTLALGFILFRIFDILKPFPIRHSETWLPDGYSVMLDDLLAGIYALITLMLLLKLVGQPFLPGLL